AAEGLYRPLPMFTFAITYFYFGQWTLPYHLTNVALHAGVVLLFWLWLLRGTLRLQACFAALWFALHPVHVEAVAIVVGRSELLVALLFLLAMRAHSVFRRTEFFRGRSIEKILIFQ